MNISMQKAVNRTQYGKKTSPHRGLLGPMPAGRAAGIESKSVSAEKTRTASRFLRSREDGNARCRFTAGQRWGADSLPRKTPGWPPAECPVPDARGSDGRLVLLQTAYCKLLTSSRGLTLIEMVVTIGVTTVISVALVQSILMFYKANRVSLEESFQIRSAERGLQAMIRDLRETTYGDDGSYPLAEMGTSTLTFYSDVDHSAPIERMSYKLTGTNLTRVVTNSTGNPPTYTGSVATTTVSDYVRNIGDQIALFRYYDSSGSEVTDPADIADVVSVSVNLVVDITPIHAPGEFTLKSSATLRNLRPQ